MYVCVCVCVCDSELEVVAFELWTNNLNPDRRWCLRMRREARLTGLDKSQKRIKWKQLGIPCNKHARDELACHWFKHQSRKTVWVRAIVYIDRDQASHHGEKSQNIGTNME